MLLYCYIAMSRTKVLTSKNIIKQLIDGNAMLEIEERFNQEQRSVKKVKEKNI